MSAKDIGRLLLRLLLAVGEALAVFIVVQAIFLTQSVCKTTPVSPEWASMGPRYVAVLGLVAVVPWVRAIWAPKTRRVALLCALVGSCPVWLALPGNLGADAWHHGPCF